MNSIKPPAPGMNYPSYLWQYVTDKTGTVYQTLCGNVGTGTPWGIRLYRCAPRQPPQMLYFIDGGNGQIVVDDINKRLLFLGTTGNRSPFYFVVDGYIYPDDRPSSTVVNVDEAQVASLKLSIATTQTMAGQASATATAAMNKTNDAVIQIANLQRTVNTLQSQVAALQSQVDGMLKPNQIDDLVWQKLKDLNYLYRLAFNAWPQQNADPDIREYVAALVNLIKRAK